MPEGNVCRGECEQRSRRGWPSRQHARRHQLSVTATTIDDGDHTDGGRERLHERGWTTKQEP